MQTLFIALQCSQCSTMQVKQRKKSSNKWSCVVCNQKQSVRNVFAQGHMAKDLRKFVQSFNMSRKIADEKQYFLDQETPISTVHDGFVEDIQRKRRTDWTEYLDTWEDCDIKQGDEGEESIVTELPKEIFKKPKLNNYDSGHDRGDGFDGKHSKSERNTSKNAMSQEKESSKYQSTNTAGNSKWSGYMTQVGEKKPGIGKHKASKWSDYIAHDEDGCLI